ncbi:MAG: protein kinase domain-containing protein [Acidimicrobiales bacterium]
MSLSVSNLGIDGLEDVEQIGTGGSSRVYRARQVDLDRIVAVKVLNPGHDQGVSKRFDRERKAMGRLSLHEGIVPVYSSGLTAHSEPYLVMPYYANGSLQDQIDAGAMEWQTAVSYIDVAAETIAAAHDEGVVHLDLKPANILLTNQGAPRIADFGIAKLTSGQGASAGTTGGAAFTPAYSAPETFLDGETGPPSDVYGLGATLWALLVGHPPFLTPGDDTNLMAVIGRVVNNPVGDLRHFTPEQVCNVIERAMAKEPEDRYQSAREFSTALKNAAAASSADFEPAAVETPGTMLLNAPPPQPNGNANGNANGAPSGSLETQMLAPTAPGAFPPPVANSASMPPPVVDLASAPPPTAASRPLLQETALPVAHPPAGPPPAAPTTLLDFDRFRLGPVLLGLLAFLGMVGIGFWALNRTPSTEATGGQVDDTVATDPASPTIDAGSGTEQSNPTTTLTGLGNGSTLTTALATPSSDSTTLTTADPAATSSTTEASTTSSSASSTTSEATTTSSSSSSTSSTTASTTSTVPTTALTTITTPTTASTTTTTATTTTTTTTTTTSTTTATTLPAPNAPTGLVATVANDKVTLNWSAPASGPTPDNYEVLRSGVAEPLGSPSGLTFTETDLSPGEYTYRVRAVANDKTSSSVSVSATVAAAPLSASVSAAPGPAQITISINANRCVEYRVSARARPNDPVTVTSGEAPCAELHRVTLGDDADEPILADTAYSVSVIVTDPVTGETDTAVLPAVLTLG